MIDRVRGDARKTSYPAEKGGSAEAWSTALVLAGKAGRGLARARNWVVDEGLERHLEATLGAALCLGVITGWLIKRR